MNPSTPNHENQTGKKWLKWLLFMSILLNLFLAAWLAGQYVHKRFFASAWMPMSHFSTNQHHQPIPENLRTLTQESKQAWIEFFNMMDQDHEAQQGENNHELTQERLEKLQALHEINTQLHRAFFNHIKIIISQNQGEDLEKAMRGLMPRHAHYMTKWRKHHHDHNDD